MVVVFMLRLAVIAAIGMLSAVDVAQVMIGRAAAQSPPVLAASSDQAAMLRGAEASDAPAPGSSGDAELTKAADGHFWAQGDVDGTQVRFLVDTGATSVALTGEDAKRLGFDPATLTYDVPVHTANGESRAARIHLASLSVGGARVEDVQAMVVAQGLPASLLGMSYLGRLSHLEATPQALILRP
jgi:aspartyl protease family protein